MKIYIKSSAYEKDYGNDFDKWIKKEGKMEYRKFTKQIEEKVRDAYNVSNFINYASFQDPEGYARMIIILSDRDVYKFQFVYIHQLSLIFSYGIEEAVRTYFNSIEDGIDSGLAMV